MAWNIDDVTKDDLRRDRRQDYNDRQKAFTKAIGENTAIIGCILIVVMFIGFIWTDMKIQLSWQRVLCDAAASIVSFILVEDLMSKSGIRCGKLYDEYVEAHKAYLTLKNEVISAGVTRMASFCEEQVEREYEAYIKRRCRELKIDYSDYTDRLSDMTLEQLKAETSVDKAVAVFALKAIKRVDLTPEILMTDGTGERYERGGVSVGALEYVKKSTRGWLNIILTVLSCFVSAGIAFSANSGASWGLVIYTLMKLALLCWRMYKGYSTGAKAYNTVEVKHLQDKMLYLNMYLEYLKEKCMAPETGASAELPEAGTNE